MLASEQNSHHKFSFVVFSENRGCLEKILTRQLKVSDFFRAASATLQERQTLNVSSDTTLYRRLVGSCQMRDLLQVGDEHRVLNIECFGGHGGRVLHENAHY